MQNSQFWSYTSFLSSLRDWQSWHAVQKLCSFKTLQLCLAKEAKSSKLNPLICLPDLKTFWLPRFLDKHFLMGKHTAHMVPVQAIINYSGQFTAQKSKFRTAQGLVIENNCISCSKAHPGSSFWLPSSVKDIFLYFCFAPSLATQATVPQSNWCCTPEYLGQACSVLPPWKYNLQACLGKNVLIQRLGAAAHAALAGLKLLKEEHR